MFHPHVNLTKEVKYHLQTCLYVIAFHLNKQGCIDWEELYTLQLLFCSESVYLDHFYCCWNQNWFCIRRNNFVGRLHCLEIFCWLTSCFPRLLLFGADKPFHGTSIIRVCTEQILASHSECWLKARFFITALKYTKSQHHHLLLITLCVPDHYACS